MIRLPFLGTSRLLAAWLTVFVCLGEPAEGRNVRIMPLGDSITESVTTFASYRYWLWHDLVDAGYEVNFVGTNFGVDIGPPLFPDFDQDHEGHTGMRADEVLANVAAWATAAQPDIVLLHLGTNDLRQGQDDLETAEEVGLIIDELRTVNPRIIVLLAQIIPSELFDVWPLNVRLRTIAASKWTPNSPIVTVDQWSNFNSLTDTWDGVHPDQDGEMKIADRWFEHLGRYLEDNRFQEAPAGARQTVTPSAPAPEPPWPWNLGFRLHIARANFAGLAPKRRGTPSLPTERAPQQRAVDARRPRR